MSNQIMPDDKAVKRYSFSYVFDEKAWCGTLWASTREEAEMKLKAMGKGKIDGEVQGVIQANATPDEPAE